MSNQPLVIIGPSGAGKSSVVKVLCERYGFKLVKTVTTRSPRDTFDTDHIFVSVNEYNAMKEAGQFFGTLDIFGAFYGLPVFKPEQKIVLLLRAPAINEFLIMFPKAVIVEIDAPLDVLKERLLKRTTSERFDASFITKEIVLSRALAKVTLDSSIYSIAEMAEHINKSFNND